MYDIAADNGGAHAGDYKTDSAGQRNDQDKARKQAGDFEKDRDIHRRLSAVHEERHHWLTGSATLIEIGIALSTVAIITRKPTFWLSAMGLGAVGIALFGYAYLS
jgi:hypothetical protein